jgi:hypothetical protein
MNSWVIVTGCSVIDVACMAESAANNAFRALVKTLGEAVVTMIGFLSSFWLGMPSPTVAQGSGSAWSVAPAVGQMQGYIAPVTAAIALVSFAIGVGRLAWQSNGDVRGLVRQVAAVGAGTLVVAAGTQILIVAGDAFSPWIIRQASGREPGAAIELMIISGFMDGNPTNEFGLWFVMFMAALLGALVQCIFMVVRAAALIVLMVFVPPTAAAAASEEGWERFKRLVLIIVGFALYKPVAAVVSATGILLMSRNPGGGDDLMNGIYGLTVMLMAALALPAFIKFLVPLAATGSSSAFSGAAAVGVVAAGAAVVATAGWGAGAAAAAPGPAGAVGGTGAAGGAGAAGAAGAASVPPAAGGGGGAALANGVQAGAGLVDRARPEEAA